MKMKWVILCAALSATGSANADPKLRAEALKLFGALEVPKAEATSSPEATLGRALFWDTRLSLDGKTACASCHMEHGADKRKASIDAKGLPTSRHSPTVFNSQGQVSFRWLGDRKSLADHAEGSMTGSMGFPTKQQLVDKMVELQYAEPSAPLIPASPSL
jgi:cytochrome c peroxidase